MKHTIEQIKAKAEIVLKDLEGKYYTENLIEDGFFREKDEIPIGVHKGETVAVWVLFIKSLFDNTDHLIISDETGEPIYIQNSNYILIDILKNEEGKYHRNMPWLEEE